MVKQLFFTLAYYITIDFSNLNKETFNHKDTYSYPPLPPRSGLPPLKKLIIQLITTEIYLKELNKYEFETFKQIYLK